LQPSVLLIANTFSWRLGFLRCSLLFPTSPLKICAALCFCSFFACSLVSDPSCHLPPGTVAVPAHTARLRGTSPRFLLKRWLSDTLGRYWFFCMYVPGLEDSAANPPSFLILRPPMFFSLPAHTVLSFPFALAAETSSLLPPPPGVLLNPPPHLFSIMRHEDPVAFFTF